VYARYALWLIYLQMVWLHDDVIRTSLAFLPEIHCSGLKPKAHFTQKENYCRRLNIKRIFGFAPDRNEISSVEVELSNGATVSIVRRKRKSVLLAQLVKVLADSTHVRSCVQEVRVQASERTSSPFKLSTFGTRAFPVASPHAWNSLPADITSAPSLSTFCQ